MWESAEQDIDGGRGRKYRLARSGRPLSYAQVIELWRGKPDFRAWFVSLLAEAPYPAYFWETPPLTLAGRGQAFEFVLIDSPELAATAAEPQPFQRHFRAADARQSVVGFPNLGGDAYLIAPCPRAAEDAYPHLGAFTRKAPEDQQHALWSAVAAALEERLGPQPLWLSTAGLGVFWLHLRLDRRPKYFSYGPYRET